MFLKFGVFIVLLSVFLALYIYDNDSTACTYLKLQSTSFKESVLYTLTSWGVLNSGMSETKLEARKERLFTVEELSKYRGINDKKVYMAILGKVYDVGAGRKHYGPGGGYHFFTGRDASRAFVTGEFSDSGLTDDVEGLSSKELKSLLQWDEFYSKEYKYKGKLIGRFYDDDGKPTPYSVWFEKMIQEAKKEEENETQNKQLYPPCNVEWSQETGSRVWCTNMSGGVKRDWVGVPRQLYLPGSKSYRCTCINTEELASRAVNQAQLKQYPNCDPKSSSCDVVNT